MWGCVCLDEDHQVDVDIVDEESDNDQETKGLDAYVESALDDDSGQRSKDHRHHKIKKKHHRKQHPKRSASARPARVWDELAAAEAAEITAVDPASLVGRSVELHPGGNMGVVVSYHQTKSPWWSHNKKTSHTIDFGDGKLVDVTLGHGGQAFRFPGTTASRKKLEEQLERAMNLNAKLQDEETKAKLECERKKHELDELKKCPVCGKGSADTALVPCGHRVCHACARHSLKAHVNGIGKACPVCHDRIRKILHLR
ncbi:hypothetical protein CTAYLR_002075 [Chrysophaeum taylorii]|uniref:RING-type domain-containing protein n=1 Tax=Chrysophaeum taylorii TaxID=2483200 RepID=A0AAD7UMK1_9STRA|nr:hypothetical protein CTAYLR_002075 [Chrysophaeum taylorii]